MTKRRLVLLAFSICLALVSAPLSFTIASAQKPGPVVTLKGLRPWPWEANDTTGYREFLTRINERAKGRLVLKDIGGSEVFPSTKQFEPLKLGTVDFLFTSTGYIADIFPEPTILIYTFGAGPDKLRAAGVHKRIDELGRKEHGVSFFGSAWFGNAHIWSTKPVKSLADFKAMKVRSHPSYDPLIKGLGIPTVTVPFGEMFLALQTGVVDAVVWPYFDLITYGLEKVIKHRIDPPLWRAGWAPFFMNAKRFDALPQDLQKLMVDTMIELEKDAPRLFGELAAKEAAKLRAAGVTTIKISDAEWREAQRVAWEKSLPETMRRVSPKYGQELIKMLGQFYPPKEPFPAVD